MILSVRNLNITTTPMPSVSICNNISFDLDNGETLGILGESGSGKSITALSILQLLPSGIKVANGEIIFFKEPDNIINLNIIPPKQLQDIRGKEISMIFQEPMSSLNPVVTCGKQVLEIVNTHLLLNSVRAKSYVLELFEKVKLPEPKRIFKSYPHQLSGGQKQRVMIAMAIACKPKILIADEPTTALDVSVQKSILDLLKELQNEMGMGIIFITHDISVVANIAHKILVMNKGEVVEYGEVAQIIKNAQHPYTRALMDCRFSVRNKGERLKTINEHIEPSIESRIINDDDNSRISNVPIFEVKQLNVSFPIPQKSLFTKQLQNRILKNIDIAIYKGETLGLVGESGSGKTTLGMTILQLVSSESGTISYRGRSMEHFTRSQKNEFHRKVQIIFQDPYSSLNPKLTIGEAIKEPMEVHGLYKNLTIRKQKVMELLEAVNLNPEYYSRYPHQFSGGQRQRIGIARALALNPELIVLDESVAALDVSIQAQVLNLLNDIKQRFGLTYLFISHDLNIVRYMSDRIIVLKDGTVAEEGNADEIFINPQSDYTRSLLGSISEMNI